VNNLAEPIERVIHELNRLPTIGRKTAQRLAFHLLKLPKQEVRALAEAITDLRERIQFCKDCFNVADDELCPICANPKRERTTLCVVEEPTNLLALERTSSYQGLYHVLGGALSPLKDIGPDELHVRELMARVQRGDYTEVIMATNPNVEGEATAVYLSRLLKPLGPNITRLAQGLPAGGDLEYTDDITLRQAFEGRRGF
jgi:recombination protein RecR